jgi:predicted  nucleic acid-binding Zn-ribbon protein
MPHRCVHCGQIYSDADKEIINGCKCGNRFFFYMSEAQLNNAESNKLIELPQAEKEKVEKEIREIIGVSEEQPVILDLETVKVIKPGKFEIDIVNLFNKDRPLIYKLEEGKYIIDLATSFEKWKKAKE